MNKIKIKKLIAMLEAKTGKKVKLTEFQDVTKKGLKEMDSVITNYNKVNDTDPVEKECDKLEEVDSVITNYNTVDSMKSGVISEDEEPAGFTKPKASTEGKWTSAVGPKATQPKKPNATPKAMKKESTEWPAKETESKEWNQAKPVQKPKDQAEEGPEKPKDWNLSDEECKIMESVLRKAGYKKLAATYSKKKISKNSK